MNNNPKQNAKRPQKGPHLDEFPDEADQIAWERAVLERARAAGLLTSGRINTKEDLFWQKLRAYEAREISKRRQRYKPSRLERFDDLAESRVERGIRHGLVDDAAMKCETKMQRRAERFGIKPQTGADGVLCGGVLEWMTDDQRLKMRRARFEKEPRNDEQYRKEWVSETDGDIGIMDEQRMAERRRRFSGETEGHDSFKMKDKDDTNAKMGDRIGKRNNGVRKCRNKELFKHGEVANEASGTMDIESDRKVLQAWERTCESWEVANRQERGEIQTFGGDSFKQSEAKDDAMKDIDMAGDGKVLQEWERTCESWGVDGGDGQSVPDAVQVNDIRSADDGTRRMELTKDNLLSMEALDESSGKVLQTWEAGGEEW